MKVFLSFASPDRATAERIQLALLGAGHEVFFDAASLAPGSDYNSRIRDSIKESQVFVFLISPSSVGESRYVHTELKLAKIKWPKPWGYILPVVIQSTEYGAIDPYLASVTVLEPRGDVAAEVAAAIERMPKPLSLRGRLSDRASRVVKQLTWLLTHAHAASVALVLAGLVSAVLLIYWSIGPGNSGNNDNNLNRVNRHQGVENDHRKNDSPPASGIWQNAFFVSNDCCIAYTSPDSIYEQIKKRIDGARESILIGVYDFTSIPVKEMLLNAVKRGVKVSLLLDYSPMNEETIVKELAQGGVEVVKAPSGVQGVPFRVYHLKVLVIDRTWTLVQSANLTPNSIPANGGAGNRDAGIAVNSKELAEYFANQLEQDKELATRVGSRADERGNDEPEQIYQPRKPVPRIPAFSTGGEASAEPTRSNAAQPAATPAGIRILPVLSPDNYMEVVPQVLAAARESIDIEQQYVRANGEYVRKLLTAIRVALQQNPNLRVRLILAQPFGSPSSIQRDLEILRNEYGFKPSDNVRLLSRESGMHCNNKMIIIDGRVCLVGSTNWSDMGVTRNREASLLIDSTALGNFYQRIFDIDWEAGIDPSAYSNPTSGGEN